LKLDWLKLPQYKNLVDFEIDFDENQATTVLLGRNGAGKSNLIEAVVEIFRDLEQRVPSTFPYEIKYVCRGKTIHLDHDPGRADSRLKARINGELVSGKAFERGASANLPSYVFAYYSGWSSRLEGHFNSPTRIHYRNVLESKPGNPPLRRMFFCRRDYSQLVLLAFFLSNTDFARKFLEQYLKVVYFESALFVLKRPWWGSAKRSGTVADVRFWGARGAFTEFLDLLWRQSFAPLRRPETVERDVRRSGDRTERQYLFIKDVEALRSLSAKGKGSKELFAHLESLFLCDLIDEVRVTVRRTNGHRVKFTQLSEGEQQLLTVLGLLLFTQDDEALYLLDEPDTHLNPVWTYDYLRLLQDNIRAEKGQLIIATHNPLMIGSLHKNQVRVLTAEDDNITAKEPDYDPMGVGVEGLLKSELYGLRSTLATEVVAKIDRHYLLLGKAERTAAEDREVIDLAKELNDMGVARSHPNPYFEQFAVAMAKHAPDTTAPQTKADIEAQAVIADQIVTELLLEEGSSENGVLTR